MHSPNWPSSESTMDSNFPQGMMPHTHSEGFDRFFMGKLSIDFVHLVILAPNMHDQDDILQNQQWTPTSFRVCSPNIKPKSFGRFCMGKLSIDFVHLVILAPNMHDQTNLPQNQPISSNFPQGLTFHTHSESFSRWCTIPSLFIFFGSLGDFTTKYAWPRWPPPKSTTDSKFGEYVYPHQNPEFWPVLNGYANLLLCSLGDFVPKYAWPNWPPLKINNGLQVSSGCDVPHPFREFWPVLHG